MRGESPSSYYIAMISVTSLLKLHTNLNFDYLTQKIWSERARYCWSIEFSFFTMILLGDNSCECVERA